MKTASIETPLFAFIFGLSIGPIAYACYNDMPAIAENLLGDSAHIAAPFSRTASQFADEALNYFLYEQGRGWTLWNLHPWGFDAYFEASPSDDLYETPVYQTAVCNEIGQCAKVSISATIGYSFTLPLPIVTIGELIPITKDVYMSPTAIFYNVDVEFQGDFSSRMVDVETVTANVMQARNDSDYDPTYPVPADEVNDPDPETCVDNNGSPTGGNSESAYDGPYQMDYYDDFWLHWWDEEEAYGGRVPTCYGDFSDPNESGVVCTFN